MEKTYYKLLTNEFKQERWLNEMYQSSWILKERAILQFIFEPCQSNRGRFGVVTTDQLLTRKKVKLLFNI